ncbi:hypothetical protein [Actinosynnema sp. NPDC020468]|uniref:hypothetical protein n=1 Tax=Actinosynnema sp. NPDC020468 TaxID=3154488 RepID=UPI0033D85C78
MIAVHGRGAPDLPVSLHDHAMRLHRRAPDEPLPLGGLPLPYLRGHPGAPEPTAVVRHFLDNPDLSADDLREAAPPALLRDAARWLVRHGIDERSVRVGLELLRGNVEPRDFPVVRTVGLLSVADTAAAAVLAGDPRAVPDLVWLAERSRPDTIQFAAGELIGHPDPAVRDWVRSTPGHTLGTTLARRIAEQHGLVDLLAGAGDDRRWDQAGNLLSAMTSTHDYYHEIARYPDAPETYRRWVDLAPSVTPAVDRAAVLASVADDLATGPAAMVVGDDRGPLVDRIKDVLTAWHDVLDRGTRSADPVEARRAAWVLARLAAVDLPTDRFAVRVVPPDPNPVGFPQVEARIVLDGVPIVAASFDKGPAAVPEWLLGEGMLRATGEPREVRLAEAYCTEGCCGGLHVTIVREGAEVVWKDWRSSMAGDPPRDVRFDAAAYDRELTRAERDHGWEWPARTVARLITRRLRADPTILGRADCEFGWCVAWVKEPDAARLTFLSPVHRERVDDPFTQYGLVIDVEDRDPEALAAEVVTSLATTDPRTLAEAIGGAKARRGTAVRWNRR